MSVVMTKILAPPVLLLQLSGVFVHLISIWDHLPLSSFEPSLHRTDETIYLCKNPFLLY